MYSQDGDIPDLPAIIAVKKKHQALLMIDEAHSIGVLGATGGGIGEHFAVDRPDVELWSGTMSKALARVRRLCGGQRGPDPVPEVHHPGFVYSVGMTPMNAAASLAALRQLRADRELLDRLRRNSAALPAPGPSRPGIDTGDSHDTPIIPCIVGDSMQDAETVHGAADAAGSTSTRSSIRRSRKTWPACASSSRPATPRTRSATPSPPSPKNSPGFPRPISSTTRSRTVPNRSAGPVDSLGHGEEFVASVRARLADPGDQPVDVSTKVVVFVVVLCGNARAQTVVQQAPAAS